MSTYFLISKCWNAVSNRIQEDPDAPHSLDACEEVEALDSLGKVLERYQFIRNFVRKSDGSCDARCFELAFLTVSPPETVDLEAFRTAVQNFLSKTKCIKRWFMAFEQRGTVEHDDIGRGKHVHILCDITPPTTFANFKTSCFNAFRGWYVNVLPKLYEWEAGKVKYLEGYKEDKKLDAVAGDRTWRAAVGLESIYSQNWA